MDPAGLDRDKRSRGEDRHNTDAEGLRAVLRHASDAIFVLEAEGTIRYVSPAVKSMLGHRPEELIGTLAFDLDHPEDFQWAPGDFRRALKSPGIGPPRRFRLRHKDGSWRHVEVVRNNLLDDPAVGGVVVTCRDITERVEAEERFRSLVQNSSDS